jgi:hypothetical protein
MGLQACRECGKQVSTDAPTCPHCGTRRPATRSGMSPLAIGCLGLLGIAVLGGIFSSDSGSSPRSDANLLTTPEAASSSSRATRYAHRAVNVRAKPSTQAAVATKLQRGATVEVDSLQGGWWVAFRGADRLGYVADEALESGPIPPVEVADWNWVKDPDFGTDGAVIWTVEIRNNTGEYLQSVRVDFTSYDASDRLVTTAFMYINGIPPGGKRSGQSYATYFGTEKRAKVDITDMR